MRKKIFTILLLVGVFLIPSALAANSQGLIWGVEEGQEIQYSMRVRIDVENTYTTTTMDETEQLVYTISTLQDIPNIVDSTSYLPYSSGTMTYANGSSISGVPVGISLSSLVLPIGNWPLIYEFTKESAEASGINATWINDFATWGFTYTMETEYPIASEMTMSVRYSKADGVVSLMSVVTDIGEEGSFETTLSRIGGPLDTTTILLIGGGIGVVLIIGVVFWKLRS